MISSIDSVLVRAAASSIASGRPSSERHRSCTVVGSRRLGRGAARGATGEQLDGVGERERRELEHAPRRRRRAATWLVHRIRSPGAASRRRTASAAAASTTCSQLSRITTRGGALEPLEQRRLAARRRSARRSARRRRRRRWSRLSSLANQTPPGDAALSAAPAGRDRDGRLADAAGPDDLDEPLAREQVGDARRSPSRARRARPTSTAGSRRAWPRRIGRRRATGRGPGSAARARCSCGPGSRPSSSASWVRTRWYVASASAWRPAR